MLTSAPLLPLTQYEFIFSQIMLNDFFSMCKIYVVHSVVKGLHLVTMGMPWVFWAFDVFFEPFPGCNNCTFKVLLTETLKIWSKAVPIQVKEVISLDNENKPVSKIAKYLGLANSTV